MKTIKCTKCNRPFKVNEKKENPYKCPNCKTVNVQN